MKKLPIIKGKNVTLRPLSLKDASNLCEWFSDEEVIQFLDTHDMPDPMLKDQRKWIAEVKKDEAIACFAIDTVDNLNIGIVLFEKINLVDKNAEYGIVIGNKRYWGQGLGEETTRLMCDFGFKKLKLHRIYLRYIAFNFRAEKVWRQVGFKKEGVLREHNFKKGYYHDEIIMGLLKNEYIKNSNKKK